MVENPSNFRFNFSAKKHGFLFILLSFPAFFLYGANRNIFLKLTQPSTELLSLLSDIKKHLISFHFPFVRSSGPLNVKAYDIDKYNLRAPFFDLLMASKGIRDIYDVMVYFQNYLQYQ